MAKQKTSGGATAMAPAHNPSPNGARPALSVKTNDKGQVFSHIRDTSEDVKGIAFERFLGRTFRGEIGQFFTPRTLVEFMVRMVEPREGEIICDPASGSGGFLIRFFDVVRQQILADADRLYRQYADELDRDGKQRSEAKRAELLRQRYDAIQGTIDQRRPGSRIWKLSNTCVYRTDANDRMARTSKMNMILHGDRPRWCSSSQRIHQRQRRL